MVVGAGTSTTFPACTVRISPTNPALTNLTRASVHGVTQTGLGDRSVPPSGLSEQVSRRSLRSYLTPFFDRFRKRVPVDLGSLWCSQIADKMQRSSLQVCVSLTIVTPCASLSSSQSRRKVPAPRHSLPKCPDSQCQRNNNLPLVLSVPAIHKKQRPSQWQPIPLQRQYLLHRIRISRAKRHLRSYWQEQPRDPIWLRRSVRMQHRCSCHRE